MAEKSFFPGTAGLKTTAVSGLNPPETTVAF
jgi:hypothetical protein